MGYKIPQPTLKRCYTDFMQTFDLRKIVRQNLTFQKWYLIFFNVKFICGCGKNFESEKVEKF